MAVRVLNAAPVRGALTVGGPVLALANAASWQLLDWTFIGKAGGRVTVWVPQFSGLSDRSQLTVRNPDGQILSNVELGSIAGKRAGTYTLNMTGTYTVTLVPDEPSTGSVAVQVSP